MKEKNGYIDGKQQNRSVVEALDSNGIEKNVDFGCGMKIDEKLAKAKEDSDKNIIKNLNGKTVDKRRNHVNLEGVPVDRGWAWIVLAGCVFYMMIFGGLMRSFGVFFLQFQQRFQAKASEVAFMSMVQNIVVSITGLLVMTVGMKKLDNRIVVAVGGILNTIGHIITGLATDIRVFYLSHGVLIGSGNAMIHPPMLAIIGVYFNKHRGLANSIFTGSGAVGGLIFAPIVIKLFQFYGYTGTLLVTSGLLLNSLVSATIMRPPKWFSKRHRQQADATLEEAAEPLMTESKYLDNLSIDKPDRTKVQFQTLINEHETQTSENASPERISNGAVGRILLQRANSFEPKLIPSSPALTRVRAWSHIGERKRTLSGNSVKQSHSHSRLEDVVNALDRSKSALYASGDVILGSVLDLQAPVQEVDETATEEEKEATTEKDTKNNCCLSGLTNVLSTVLDCTLLKNIVFIQYLGMAFVTLSGMAIVPVYIPPFANDNGVSYDQIAIMLSAMACVDLVSKITTGIIADRKWFRRTTILGAAAFATGTLCHLARFFTTFPLIMTMAVTMACFYGLYNAMFATILIDVIGLRKFQSSLGFVTLVHGISVAIFFPLSGLLRDVLGSYIYSLHLCGLLAYIGAALLFLLPVVQRKLKAKEEKGESRAN